MGKRGGMSNAEYIFGRPHVDRHLFYITSCDTTKTHSLLFRTFSITCPFGDLLDHCNCMDPHRQEVSYLLTCFLQSMSWNSSPYTMGFKCCERCGEMLMVGSLHSRSLISPQRPPSGASLGPLNGRLRLCLTTICGEIDHIYRYRDSKRIHGIWWGSTLCDCNNDEYDRGHTLC